MICIKANRKKIQLLFFKCSNSKPIKYNANVYTRCSNLDAIDSRVRKCEDVSTIIDKKMRTRTIKFEKFIIPLSDNNPFELNEFIKVLRKIRF